MSTLEPPPIHGPVRSTLPSGSRGIGWLLASASETVGVGRKMYSTSPAAGPGAAPPTCCDVADAESASTSTMVETHSHGFMTIELLHTLHSQFHHSRRAR